MMNVLAILPLVGFAVGADTVHVSRAMIARALDNPAACMSPDAGKGVWTRSAMMVQAGSALLLADSRVAIIDRDAGRVRLLGPDGREIMNAGGRGAGPGEFSAGAAKSGAPKLWAGDTVVVYDSQQARLMLYTPAGFARQISIADNASLVGTGFIGRLSGGLVFGKSFSADANISKTTRLRGHTNLMMWKPGQAQPQMLRDRIPMVDLYYVVTEGRKAPMLTNFGNKLYLEESGDQILVYDDATSTVELLGSDGKVRRVISIDLPNPKLTAADRDSVTERLNSGPAASPLLAEARKYFPETRAAVSSVRLDNEGGLWFAFAPPVAKGDRVYVRVSPTGVADRCFRLDDDARALTLSKDRVVIARVGEDMDEVNVQRTVMYAK